MHKIKEMLHKDDDDKKIEHKDHKHAHEHKDLKHSHDHVHEREIIREGAPHTHTHTTTTTVHEHGRDHHDKMKMSGEKHIYHERETMRGGDLYREGADPTLNREIASECRHDGGVERARVAEDAIVKEKIKEVELHKVQPVIHREREQKEIRHVVEAHKKLEVHDTKVLHKEREIDLGTRREASTLETSRDMHAPVIEASREMIGRETKHQELPTQVEEHVHRKVIEHVHPVIYKETLKPKVTEETHHIYETVKEKPIETYEVKELRTRDMGSGLADAERSFFTQHGSRGIDVDLHKGCTHSHGATCQRDIKTVEHVHHHDAHHHQHMAAEPIIGHHQNIGAHHLPAGAVPVGHNTAYDAALADTSKLTTHSERDVELMKKMDEKRIAKDEKLMDKKKDKAHKDKSHKNVSVV
eukprot:TRINITY_DN25_c0_g1_i6.p1 TRINITY_DN25_c0_g1~~TRINITY_DN25_c0_g1_i6.p1  ORF type:complete len:413 (+),score=102.59 TRINITY_DN25_c0_g1_i6:125-1363(+)